MVARRSAARSHVHGAEKQPTARRQHSTAAPTPPADSSQPPTNAPWRAQVDRHFYLRKQVIARLQRLHPVLSTDSTLRHAGQDTHVPELVQRLELMLYKAASSLEEYMNPCTLERRVHALVTLLEPLPPPPFCQSVQLTPRKRRRTQPATENSKRRRCDSLSPVSTTDSSVNQLTSLSSDVLGQIFGYLDGVETLSIGSLINRTMHVQAPLLVSSLSIDVAQKSHAKLLHRCVGVVLSKCSNLQQLVLTNSRNTGKLAGFPRHSRSVDNNSAGVDPRTAYATATDPMKFTGRVFLYELGQALHHATTVSKRVLFPRLQSVHLLAPFDCANEADSTIHFLSDLGANFTVAASSRSPLRSLVLDTTVLGDRRMPRLASLINQYPAVFQEELEEFNLTNNFIGEAGARHLRDAFAGSSWKALHSLGLRRNILSDHDVGELATLFTAASFPALKSLDVSENFIGKPGLQALALAAKPRDFCVQVGMNCMEAAEAGRLFM